jgi:curved DNA-binding protein CbpA
MNPSFNNTSYYEILGLPAGSSKEEVVKAYKKKALVMHPDKGGNPEEVSRYFLKYFKFR